MSEFFAMGGYGQYVWTAYATFIVVMAAIGIAPWLKHRQVKKQVRQRALRDNRKS